jgi:hypothetical protein
MAELPAFSPIISHLKRQAKDLKRAVDQRQAAALARAAAQQVETGPYVWPSFRPTGDCP